MSDEFSTKVKGVIAYSKEEALRLGHGFVGTEHFILGMLKDGNGKAIGMLKASHVDMDVLRQKIESLVPVNKSTAESTAFKRSIHLTSQADRAIKTTYLEAKSFKSRLINTGHLLLAILRNEKDPTARALNKLKIYYDGSRDLFNKIIAEDQTEEPEATYQEEETKPENTQDRSFSLSSKPLSGSNVRTKTPVLDNFGKDLTALARQGKLDPLIGRDKEIERVSQILSRRKKNNPILIGEPGVGKSAIAEGLALRIVNRNVSRILFNKRVVTLDVASLVAGTKYRGQFEERMKALMSELEKNAEIILFIDEIHTMVGAGGATGSLDASNIFKPALARGEIQCIGATTLNEYKQHIEKDGALERRFQKIVVEQTSIEETIEILHNIKGSYQEHHGVTYTDNAIEACVYLTDRYITDRFFPDKAIDALDEAGARVHITTIKVPEEIINLEQNLKRVEELKGKVIKEQEFEAAAKLRDDSKHIKEALDLAQKKWQEDSRSHSELVTEDHIASVVSMMSGIPVNKVAQEEKSKLKSLKTQVQKHIIGQDEAIDVVVKAIQRNRAGLKDANKPVGTFIFLGQTGVGKTQLAKVIASELFGSADALIRVDMGEYIEKFSSSRLIGAPPGYVGYEEGGQLTEKVRRRPYAVVLLDEIEKAHSDVFNMLLQVLDDGYITDSLNRKIDFRNTVIIMTSNIGSRQIKDFGQGVGFNTSSKLGQSEEYRKDVIEKSLKKVFTPEFLNRIDANVIFKPLEKHHLEQIVDIELAKLCGRLESLGYKLNISKKAKGFICDKGFDQQYGARLLKRTIQNYVEDLISEEIVSSTIKAGDTIFIDFKSSKSPEKLLASIIPAQKQEKL